jgi:hypothetical protein
MLATPGIVILWKAVNNVRIGRLTCWSPLFKTIELPLGRWLRPIRPGVHAVT